MKLKDKVAIVTGAGSGIGKSIALLYAKEGAKVVVSDINTIKANETVKEIIDSNREAVAIFANVSDDEQVQRLVDQTVKIFGTFDILVNNAVRGEVLLQNDIMDRYRKAKLDKQQQENAMNALSLSDKELAVLQAVAKGYKSRAIAFDLGVTERTIKARLTSIYNKLGVDSRAEAVNIGIQKGLIDIR